jgi:hypothetical protein
LWSKTPRHDGRRRLLKGKTRGHRKRQGDIVHYQGNSRCPLIPVSPAPREAAAGLRGPGAWSACKERRRAVRILAPQLRSGMPVPKLCFARRAQRSRRFETEFRKRRSQTEFGNERKVLRGGTGLDWESHVGYGRRGDSGLPSLIMERIARCDPLASFLVSFACSPVAARS